MRTAILILLIFIGCSTEPIVPQKNYNTRLSPIPDKFIAKMDSFIVSKTGEIVFKKYFMFDSIQSGLFPGNPSYLDSNVVEENRYRASNYFTFVYYFRFPDKPWHSWKLWWPADTAGGFIKYQLPSGIPDCQSNPSNCTFSIDSLKAIAIAKTSGISTGITPLSAALWWDKGKIVWIVATTLSRTNGGAEVKCFTIDLSTGEVLTKGGWSIVH